LLALFRLRILLEWRDAGSFCFRFTEWHSIRER
jgi:hypothetical protein